MGSDNQAPGSGETRDAPGDAEAPPPGSAEAPDAPGDAETPPPRSGAAAPFATALGPSDARHPGAPRWSTQTGLLAWLGALLVLGVGGMLVGQQELAGLVALAWLFVAAHAADLDSSWKDLYGALAWVVPIGGAATFAGTTILIAQSELAGPPRWIVLAISAASGLACVAMLLPPVSDRITRTLLRAETPSRCLRLAAQLVVAGLLLTVPGWFALRNVLEGLLDSGHLMDELPAGGGLLGYVLLALGAVGFLVRRDLRTTLQRLGLKGIGARDLLVVALGVGALFALNLGGDWLQQRQFPTLWASDQAFNESLASGLTPLQMVMLGLSAGIGEEITLRGALQPRLGLTLTSLLFATLHVQYSWYGMVVIFVLGSLLGAIRQRTSTSVAIAVHTIYDVIAVANTPR